MKKRLSKIYMKLFEFFGPQNWWPGDTPFEVAVGAVLTQNTNWKNASLAIANLKKARALSARAINNMDNEELAALIRPAGYFNLKAKRLKSFVAFLTNSYGGSMKSMARADMDMIRPELLSVYGIGPETADSIMLYALEMPVFVVDAYTKRIFSRHGIMDEAAGYETFRALFEDNLPQDVQTFNEYHALIVALGKDYCRPKNPKCSICPLESI
jgi:endonuclease-3 related protein